MPQRHHKIHCFTICLAVPYLYINHISFQWKWEIYIYLYFLLHFKFFKEIIFQNLTIFRTYHYTRNSQTSTCSIIRHYNTLNIFILIVNYNSCLSSKLLDIPYLCNKMTISSIYKVDAVSIINWVIYNTIVFIH